MRNDATRWISGTVEPLAPLGLRGEGKKQLSEPGHTQAVWMVGPVTSDGDAGHRGREPQGERMSCKINVIPRYPRGLFPGPRGHQNPWMLKPLT